MQYGKVYREMTIVNIKKVLLAPEIASNMKHPVLNGRVKEILIKDLLEPYLYPNMGICTGVIIDSKGNQSKQIDIIIYDKKVLAPLTLSAIEGAIPAESVLATIEVKSMLTNSEMTKSFKNALSVKNLVYDFDDISLTNKFNQHLALLSLDYYIGQRKEEEFNKIAQLGLIEHPSCFIFAFDTKLSEKSINVKLNEFTINNEPTINSLCIANNLTFNLYNSSDYECVKNDGEFENVISFIIAVMRKCNKLSQERIVLPLEKYLEK